MLPNGLEHHTGLRSTASFPNRNTVNPAFAVNQPPLLQPKPS